MTATPNGDATASGASATGAADADSVLVALTLDPVSSTTADLLTALAAAYHGAPCERSLPRPGVVRVRFIHENGDAIAAEGETTRAAALALATRLVLLYGAPAVPASPATSPTAE